MEFSAFPPFLLSDFTESEGVNLYNSKSMSQDGKNYIGNTLDIKDIAMETTLVGTTEEELINLRSTVYKTFNPKLNEGWLVYKDSVKERKVQCIASKIPYFTGINDIATEGLINLSANNPYWLDIEETKKELVSWIPDFSFSEDGNEGLELVDGGIEMGHREQNLIVDIFNGGDVECGITLEFKANAAVVNPKLLNVNTGEYITINKSMVPGEKIIITTEFGHKTIKSTINRVTTNAFNYVDLGSTFLQLDVGDNIFTYSATSGLISLDVTIYYTQKYLGV